MKWVAISLLLLNGIFLAVQLNIDQQPEKQVDRFPFSGPELMLLAEKEKLEKAKQLAEKNRRKALAQAKASKPKKKPAKTVAQAPTTVKPKPAPSPKSKPEPKPAPKPVPKPAPKPASPPASPSATSSNAMACYSVGPFLLISDVKGVSQLFKYADIIIRERSEALRKQVGYWAYVPPFASLQEAKGALSLMKNNGIDNALIITEGTKANSISVGVYNTEALGIEQQKVIIELGYPAKVEPLFRTQPQYWLDLELMKSTKVPDKIWREVVAGYPDLQQLRRKCE